MMAETAPKAPPNLRVSGSEDKECDSCAYYRNGHCSAFPPLCVDDEWVCDHYKPGGQGDDDDARPFQGRNLREANEEAYTRVRAHRRRIRSSQQETGGPNSGLPDKTDNLK